MGEALVTVDTSALFTLLNRRDPRYETVSAVLSQDPGPYLIPAGILGEAAYLIERRFGTRVLDLFLGDLERGTFALDCGEEDLARIRELVRRYADLPLGFADAAVIACAERHGGKVLTLDRRDFGVVAREGTISLLPD